MITLRFRFHIVQGVALVYQDNPKQHVKDHGELRRSAIQKPEDGGLG